MARPKGSETKRKNVVKSFRTALLSKGMDDAVYDSRLEQYMEFYDRKCHANTRLINIESCENPDDNMWIKISGEVRQLDRSMLEIEKYFGFKPSEDSPDVYEDL